MSTRSQSEAPTVEDLYFPFCDEVMKYEIITKIGRGTFGKLFKARHKVTKNVVALKKIATENETEGFPITALREIRILSEEEHTNVVNLVEVYRVAANASNPYIADFYLAYDFCEHDLAGLLSNVDVKYSLGEIKNVMRQLMSGLHSIHVSKILHRNIKPSSVLITKNGKVKLSGFSRARPFSVSSKHPNRYDHKVVTLWYRPPELLLGERNYGPSIDMWGIGCILAEMCTRKPIMPGNTEQQQLTLIAQLCGSPTPEIWPNVQRLELYEKISIPKEQKRRVKEKLVAHVRDLCGLDLIDKLLTLDPSQRLDCNTALHHEFFWTDPMPCDLRQMLSQFSDSIFDDSEQNCVDDFQESLLNGLYNRMSPDYDKH